MLKSIQLIIEITVISMLVNYIILGLLELIFLWI